jgi:hypothetical protein
MVKKDARHSKSALVAALNLDITTRIRNMTNLDAGGWMLAENGEASQRSHQLAGMLQSKFDMELIAKRSDKKMQK